MIPSDKDSSGHAHEVYQRGLVIDSQLAVPIVFAGLSVLKGIGD